MKKIISTGLLCISILSSLVSQNTDTASTYLNEVVITDSKFELNRAHSGKTVIKISKQELDKQAGKSLATIINQLSGVEINGSRSHAGQNLSYNIRGGNNRQVLVLIDGVQINDASRIANDFDWRLIHIDLIESIEIVKGAASTLYGSGAATAVISIKTKSETAKPIDLTLSSSVGTNQSQDSDDFQMTEFSNAISANGKLGIFNYSGSFGQRYTNGLSSVIDTSSVESDRFSALNANLKMGVRLMNKLSINAFGSFDHIDSEFDNSFPIENAMFDSESKQDRFGISASYDYDRGSLHLNGSYHTNDRIFESNFPNEFNSKGKVLDLYNKYNLNNKWHLITGINFLESEMTVDSLDVNMNQLDPYLNAVYVSGIGLQLNGGVRLNNHSEYGNHTVYSINPSYLMHLGKFDMKLLGSYATSFITPTLNQLFGQFGPNPELTPEVNQTIEAGLAFFGNKNLRLSALYFNREEEDFIDFIFTDENPFGIYNNDEESSTIHGLEIEASIQPIQKLILNANYTFTESQDRTMLRVPKHKLNASLGYQLNEQFYSSISHQFTGKRKDTDFTTFEDETLDAFNLIDWYVSYQTPNHKTRLFLEITNLFNEDYTEIIGFTTKGRNGRVGVLLNL